MLNEFCNVVSVLNSYDLHTQGTWQSVLDFKFITSADDDLRGSFLEYLREANCWAW